MGWQPERCDAVTLWDDGIGSTKAVRCDLKDGHHGHHYHESGPDPDRMVTVYSWVEKEADDAK